MEPDEGWQEENKWYKMPEVLTEDALATPVEQEQKDTAEEGEQTTGSPGFSLSPGGSRGGSLSPLKPEWNR